MGFSEIRSVLASNTGSNRITLQGDCIDAVLVGFYNSNPLAHSVTTTDGSKAVANAPRYQFAVADAQKNALAFQLTVGSEVFPRQAVQKISELCGDITTNAIYGNSAMSQNLLYLGATSAGVAAYSREYLATNGAISITKFGLGEEGWASSMMHGLATNSIATDCVVASNQAAATHLLIATLQTSQLVFDPQTSAVSIQA
jgi:hypothetical protein